MAWPDGQQASWTYDGADRFASVRAGGASVAASYDALSRITSVTSGAVTTTVGYDNADRMASLAHGFQSPYGGSSPTWSFGYSPASQLTAFTSTNSAWNWSQATEELPKLRAELDVLRIGLVWRAEALGEARDLASRWPDLPQEEKREILEAITDRITVGKEEIEINLLHLPPGNDAEKATRPQGFMAATS